MARIASQEGLRPSMLDRLVDPESEGTSWRRGYSVDQMIDAVRKDLEDLLNSHRTAADIPEELAEVRRSIVAYGIPDLSSYQTGGSDARAAGLRGDRGGDSHLRAPTGRRPGRPAQGGCVQGAEAGLRDPGDAAARPVARSGLRHAPEAHHRRGDDPAGGRVSLMSESSVSLLRARADVHPPVRAGVRPAVPGHGRAAAAGAQSQHRPARRAADRVVRAVDRADPAQARRRVPRADHRAAGRALPALPGADPVDGDRAVRPGRRAVAVARGVRDRPSQPAEHPAGGGPALPVSHRLPGAALAGPGLGREAGPAAVPARA